jgi:hypothetical protein
MINTIKKKKIAVKILLHVPSNSKTQEQGKNELNGSVCRESNGLYFLKRKKKRVCRERN